MYIKHLAESASFKGSTFNKHRHALIGNRIEMPNAFIFPSVMPKLTGGSELPFCSNNI